MQEDNTREFKSLKKAIGKQADLKSLAETCVAFANAQGGELIIGIENKNTTPPIDQEIDIQDINDVVKRLRSLTDGVGMVNPELIKHENGGEFIRIIILVLLWLLELRKEQNICLIPNYSPKLR